MGRLFFGLLCAVVVSACSSSPPASSAVTCVDRLGSYTVTFTVGTPGCPAIADQTIDSNSPLALGESGTTTTGCTNTGIAATENCIVSFDVVCATNEERGSVTWNPSGTSGKGSLTTVNDDAGASCLYTISLAQQ